jgi:uncharacterized membrane protein YesL
MEKQNLFDQELPLWRILNRVTDVLILAFMWTVTSLPLITLGASCTAVYYVMLKMVRNEEGYLWKGYWKAFRENFKQSTVLWLLLLVLGLFFAGDIYYYYVQQNTITSSIQALFMGLMLVLMIVLLYVFPIISRFSNTTGKLLSMALFLPFKHLGWTLALLALFAVFVFLAWYIIPFAVLAYGVYAYCSCYIFVRIFKPYEDAIRKKQGLQEEASE